MEKQDEQVQVDGVERTDQAEQDRPALRARPPVDKPVDDATSFVKTLVRLIRIQSADELSWTEAGQRALRLMPWFPEHYLKLRGEALTEKYLRDLGSTKTTTYLKYRPVHRHGLTSRKQAECLVAERLLAHDPPITKEELEAWRGLAVAVRTHPE